MDVNIIAISFSILLLAVLASFSNAQNKLTTQDKQVEVEIQIEKAKYEIYSWNLIQKLQLTHQQLQQILAVAREVEPMVEKYRRKQAVLLIVLEKSLERFHAHVAQSDSPSTELEKEVGSLDHEVVETRKEFYDRVNEFEKKVEQILTPQQMIVVEHYQPRLSMEKNRNRDKSDLVAFLVQVRNMPQHQFDKEAPRWVDRYLQEVRKRKPREEGTGPVPPEHMQLPSPEHVQQVLKLVRELPDREFQENMDQIVEQLLPVDTTRKARKELRRINDETHGNIGNIGKFLLVPECIVHYERLLKTSK